MKRLRINKNLLSLFFVAINLLTLCVGTGAASALVTPDGGGTSAGATSTSSFDPSVDQHVDRSTIIYGGVYYFDNKIDDNYTYTIASKDGCTDKITDLRNSNKTATLYTYSKDAATGRCNETKTDISLAHPERATMPFDIMDATTIITSDKKVTYKFDTSKNEYLEVGGDRCKDIVKITDGPNDSGAKLSVLSSSTKEHRDNTNYKDWDSPSFDYNYSNTKDGCHTYGPNDFKASTVYLNNATQTAGAPANTGAGGTGGSGGSNVDSASCENNAGPLGWIVCGVIDFAAKAVDGIYGSLIQPLLVTHPLSLSTGTDNQNYQTWSIFRIIGDVFLVIALLVIVFGQSLGGGLIDAYAAKKILPRLIAAAILINLSYYIVAVAIDVSNVIGGGVQNLIMAPFHISGQGIQVGYGTGTIGTVGAFSAAIGGLWAVGAAGGAAAAAGAVGAFALEMLAPFLLFVLVPAVLLMISIVAILIFRQGLILLLVFTAPVAFALYCLPNTEQYFKKWWDLLLKTLMLYPIIALIFGVANALSITITNASGFGGPLKVLIAIIALFVPLFLIPFAFKIAGGVLGRFHEILAGGGKRGLEAIKGNPNDPNSLRNRMRGRGADASTRFREKAIDGLGGRQKELGADGTYKRSRFARRGLTGLSTVIGAGDLEARRSKLNKDEAEKRELKTGYGPDQSVRALFAEKDDKGVWRSSVNGAVFSDYEVAQANSLYGKNLSGAQSAIDYEVGKAGNEEEYANFLRSAPKMLSDRGYNEDQINGAMKGVGFKNQAKRLDLKHSKFEYDASADNGRGGKGAWTRTVDHAAMSQDAAENFGSYPLSNMKVSPIEELGIGFDKAKAAQSAAATAKASGKSAEDIEAVYAQHGFKAKALPDGGKISGEALAARTVKDVTSTAQVLQTSMMRQGGMQQGEADDSPVGMTGGTGAAGHVNEAINKLVQKVSPTPPAQPRQPQGPSGPTIITPGSSNFNIPPGSRP